MEEMEFSLLNASHLGKAIQNEVVCLLQAVASHGGGLNDVT